MAAFPSYSTGTVSVSNGGTVVTGAGGANWSGSNVKPGDDLIIGANRVMVVDVTDSTHLLIDAYPGTTVSGSAYKIYKTSPLRFAGGDAMADVSTLVAVLNTDGFYVFVDSADSVPDPSYGEENQFAFQPSTSKLWLKTGGIWVLQGIYKGFSVTGPWNSGTAYKVGDVVSLNGNSYVATAANTNQTPPNVTYWAVLASQGASVGITLNYSSTTTDADPGTGIFRLNNATPASATLAFIDNAQVGGAAINAILDTWDDSTNTIRGTLRIQKANDALVWAQYNVTGTVVDGTGYRKITLANGVGSGAFTNADQFVLNFSPAGSGLGYGGTSTTSLTIGTGSRAFTTQAGLAYAVGQRVRASNSVANWMEGLVASYSSTTLTLTIDRTLGSGTLASWAFGISGEPGAAVTFGTTAGTATEGNDTRVVNAGQRNATNTWTSAQTFSGNNAHNGNDTHDKTATPNEGTLTSASAADFSTKQRWKATVNGGAFTIANPTNPVDRCIYDIAIDFTTAHGVTFGSNFKIGDYVPTAAAGKKDRVAFEYNSAATQFFLRGYRRDVSA